MLLDNIRVRVGPGHRCGSGSGARGGVASFVMRNITVVLIVCLATCREVLRILEVTVVAIFARRADVRNEAQQQHECGVEKKVRWRKVELEEEEGVVTPAPIRSAT